MDDIPIIPPEFLDFMDEVVRNMTTTSSTNVSTIKQEMPRVRQPKTTWRKGRKMAGNVPYTTDLDRRKRSEVRALQLEIEHLSARLAQLTQPQQTPITAGPIHGCQALEFDQSQWSEVATAEKEKRLRAEEIRRRLKAVVLRQSNAIDSIRSLLRRSNVFEGRDFVESLQPTTDQRFLHVNSSKQFLEGLSGSMDQLRVGADDVLSRLDHDLVFSLRSRTRQHDIHGSCVETSEVMHMARTTREAAEILWGYVLNPNNAAKAFSIIQVQSASSSMNNCEQGFVGSQGIRDTNGDLTRGDAMAFFRKYEEENCVVIVGTMARLMPIEGLQFEEKYWTTISPTSADSMHSVIRTFSQLTVRNGSAKPLSAKQEKMMEYFGRKSHRYMQLRLDEFTDKAYVVVT